MVCRVNEGMKGWMNEGMKKRTKEMEGERERLTGRGGRRKREKEDGGKEINRERESE